MLSVFFFPELTSPRAVIDVNAYYHARDASGGSFPYLMQASCTTAWYNRFDQTTGTPATSGNNFEDQLQDWFANQNIFGVSCPYTLQDVNILEADSQNLQGRVTEVGEIACKRDATNSRFVYQPFSRTPGVGGSE